MKLPEAEATVSNLDSFIVAIGSAADETGAAVQAFDTWYIVDREHLERAVESADRAITHGDGIARDHAVEILLYANGRRQINHTFEIGISKGTLPVVVLANGDGEVAAEVALFSRLDFGPAEALGDYGRSLIRDVFDVGETELHVADGDLPALVRERVALLAVNR